MLAVVVSRADEASVAIGDQLRDLADWQSLDDPDRPDAEGGTGYRADGVEVREFEDLHLHLERPAAAFAEPDLLVFASRHSGETGPLLTVHHTGNLGPAEHGGEPNSLARAAPNAHARALGALVEHAPAGYEVGTECTHHGPTDVGAPSLFVEVGSGPDQWTDPDAARAAARATLEVRDTTPDREPEREPTAGATGADHYRRHLVGIGGGHYAPRFERVSRETDWAVGHVLADWGLGAVDGDARDGVVAAALAESAAAYALFDGDRPAVERTVEAAGGRVVGETWVRETDGVPLAFVERVEAATVTVGSGLRFGAPAAGYDGSFVVVDLPAELLVEARGIDRERVLDTLAEHALAYATDQGGTRPTGTVVLRDAEEAVAVVETLVDLLGERYDEVTVDEQDGERVAVARERAFDPERARTLGVPEGPKFGRLAQGESVEVNGETVPPEAVHEDRERRFPLATIVIRASDTGESA